MEQVARADFRGTRLLKTTLANIHSEIQSPCYARAAPRATLVSMSGYRFSDSFLAELKARIRPSDLIGQKVKLRKQGKEWVGLSPFTAEKTPSFYVNDQKHFYKCFSSGKFGDVIGFLQETERLSFNEAVERLAAEAGMALPTQTPEDRAARSRRDREIDVLETVTTFFETKLQQDEGAAARRYLAGRGLDAAACKRHRIGFAPDGWCGLIDYMESKGTGPHALVEAGLAIQPEGRKDPYDRFRGRIIFPIEDVQGKVIAFGGRALEKDAKPKYLNSPETALFSKGSQLYRYRKARAAAADLDANGLVVCEGYMDAIALAEAGFGHGVAPLGTALTEDQLALLWRAGGEPVLCFDGDAAGIRAAHSAIDRALPLLEPGRSLFFTLLPDGLDPDDMIARHGKDAMGEALKGALPLVDLLWQRERDREPLDTPERRAALEDRLQSAIAAIKHEGVRKAYLRELMSRARDHLFQQRRYSGGNNTKTPAAASVKADPQNNIRGLGILVRLIASPELLDQAQERLGVARFPDASVDAIKHAMLDLAENGDIVSRSGLMRHLRHLGNTKAAALLASFPQPANRRSDSTEVNIWLDALEKFCAVGNLSSENAAGRGPFASVELAQKLAVEKVARENEIKRLSANEDTGSSGRAANSSVSESIKAFAEAVARKSGR